MSGKSSVFIIGAGLIGWSVLDLLVAEGYSVTALVRRESHAKDLESCGAKAVIGDLENSDLITKLTSQHDIVLHTATADHLPSVQAVIAGLEQRASLSKHSIFIHTSGLAFVNDGADGEWKSDKVYSDSDRAAIDAFPDTAFHRNVDTAIEKAQKIPALEKFAKIAIMVPPTIYGVSHGRLSIQIPFLARFALSHGYAGHIGKGLSVNSQIHVLDLARGYVALLHHMETASATTFLDNPYFFCENGAMPSWLDVSTEIGRSLHAAGKIQDAAPKTIPKEEYANMFGEYTGPILGLNSLATADRLRALGWEAKEKGWVETFREDELPVLLKE